MERMMRSAAPGMETKTMHNRSDEIKRNLERKNDAYDEFLSATLLLKKALEAGEMEKVNHLLERRAALIGEVDGLDREMIRFQKTVPYDQPAETVRKTAAVSEDLGEKLRRIIFANRDCDAVAADRLLLLRKELQVIREKEEGLQGYIRPVQQLPKFLNVRT
jgi:hypothetical protein